MINFSQIKKVYFIGIKGSGVIALVEILHNWGKTVTGSDVKDEFFTDEILKKKDIKYYEGFSKENIEKERDVDLVIYSTAYKKETNEELNFALESGLPCLSYPEAIGEIMRSKYGIAVCGTHGKTTTTAMLALAMKEAGADPTAVVGSKINQLKASGLAGLSQYFIIEADEYQNKFLHYNPTALILTNLDFDHPDFFPDFKKYKETFNEFIKRIPSHGFLVAWGGSYDTLEVVKEARCKIIIYDDFANNVEKERIARNLEEAGKTNIVFVDMPSSLALAVPGRHNRLNATAVWAMCQQLKLDGGKVLAALNGYQGTSRRFEKLGERNGAQVIDDYAHHPAEIQATLAAARERYADKNIICVFHPHTFTRTQALLAEFAQSFGDCNEVIVLDIYGSARETQGGVHSQDLVDRILDYKSNVQYIPTVDKAYDALKGRLNEQDVLITMGAGDVDKLGRMLIG